MKLENCFKFINSGLISSIISTMAFKSLMDNPIHFFRNLIKTVKTGKWHTI